MKDLVVSICPITRAKLTSKPDWENVQFNSGFSISYNIVEKNILLCKAVGAGNLDGLKQSLNFASKIIEENFINKPFVCIEDFAKILSPSSEGRKYYINFMKSMKKMKGLVYFNLNPILSLSIKLARKLNFFNFDVYIAKNYPDAIKIALKVLDLKKSVQNNIEYSKKTNPAWDLEFDDYSVRSEVIKENILHIISEGVLGIEHIEKVFKYQINFIKENFHDKLGKYYYVVDLSKVSVTRECRNIYAKKIQSIYNLFPFKSYVYYGGNRLINISIALGVPFISFNLKKEKNLKGVLDYIKRNDTIKKKKIKKQRVSNETQSYIDEFLIFLGKINWENNGPYTDFKKDTSHPFYQVYDAITLIKSDLDELYLERKKNEEEKNVLQFKLQQSLKLETMGKLAGSVAHDLNNVLSGIVSYPDIILKELPQNKENEKAVKYIKRMKKSGQKAADIVQDLLTLSRSGVVNFEVLNINSIIEDYLKSPEIVKLNSINPKISIKCRLSEKLNNISASSIHLTKTIMNLVTNAVEAISDQGIIKITTKNKSFKNKKFKGYDQKADGDFIELIVSDTGSGISDQDLPKIFEPFYSKKVMGRSGTGLGMLVIKGTVDDHNGFIIINSEEKKGTEFLLYFPVKEERANKKFVQKIDNYTGSGESILITDDDEDQRIIAYKILKELHYSVKTVASGEEAIEFLKNKKFDLIVLDMIMEPGIGGLETYKQARNINPNQKAVIVSGYSATNHVAEAQKLGAGQYIRKPYTIEDIGIAVFKELNKK